jgi:hypothetical protein
LVVPDRGRPRHLGDFGVALGEILELEAGHEVADHVAPDRRLTHRAEIGLLAGGADPARQAIAETVIAKVGQARGLARGFEHGLLGQGDRVGSGGGQSRALEIAELGIGEVGDIERIGHGHP